MNTKLIVAVVLIVALGAGAVVVGGDLLSGGNSDDTEPFPTATATQTPASGDDGGAEGATTTAASTGTPTPPFAFTIDNIEECGQTCRDVTSTLTNQQDTTAEDVTVYTRMFAGNETNEDDEVWRGSADVGTLEPGESHTETRRVELSLSDGLAIQNAGGWITIQTTVETADQTITFSERRKVA
ncbi:hypothetical protein [Halobellus ordinarius]|jgi:hypothetical protein|uniref:hypothetical protein n=1 Tax=Halobellus ordinarius TaxID=3075120 RepID=UPI002880409B|nr:hypothetical protein [Halobellus sp. ZY16]